MSVSNPRARINEQILEEACGWLIECNEAELDQAARESFNQWLRRSPEHVRAYLEIASTWEGASGLTGSRPVDLEALVAKSVETDPTPGARKLPRLFRAIAAAAAASVLLALGTSLMSPSNTYTTGIGEQRSIILADGSTVELDTRSQLRVRFSHAERLVELVDGQALFQVNKDATRPFTVFSSGTRIRAVGTQFDVYLQATTTAVTVIEGRVAVTEMPPTTQSTGAKMPLFLSAGEQLIVTPTAVPHVARADVAATTAWTQYKLVFDETPLSEAIAEFNRYNLRRIIIEDPSLASYHIRGSFEAGDPDRLLQLLRNRFDAQVREQGDEIRISRK